MPPLPNGNLLFCVHPARANYRVRLFCPGKARPPQDKEKDGSFSPSQRKTEPRRSTRKIKDMKGRNKKELRFPVMFCLFTGSTGDSPTKKGATGRRMC